MAEIQEAQVEEYLCETYPNTVSEYDPSQDKVNW